MNKRVGVTSILFTLSLVLPCAAAERAVLIEACAAMPDAGKRADCFEALARMPADSKPSQQSVDFQGVNRAATALLSAIDVGVSYRDYSGYVQQLATEVALLKQQAKTDSDRAAVEEYEKAVEAYRDAGAWWDASLRFYSRRDNELAYAWGLPIDQVGMATLASKYSMQIGKADMLGLYRGVPQSVGLSTIWRAARDASQRAALAAGQPAPASLAANTIAAPGPTKYWLGSRTEKIYYHPSCQEASRIAASDRWVFVSEQAAHDRGYRRSTQPGC